MLVSITNPVHATWIFAFFFITATVFSLRKTTKKELFPSSLTQELKGCAILSVMLGHIGYFLVTDNRFLFPFSILSGVGVNLFLFLSGFGLVVSSMRKQFSIRSFYFERMPQLYVPLWIVIGLFVGLDFFILDRVYSASFIREAFTGIFLHADLETSLNSPLWYFTFILFYYLCFPLVYRKKFPWLGALGILIVSMYIIRQTPELLHEVIHLYKIHVLAFPLGMIVGNVYYYAQQSASKQRISSMISRIRLYLENVIPVWYARAVRSKLLLNRGLIAALIFFTCYFAYYSSVGKSVRIEQLTSIVILLLVLVLFVLKKYEIRLFSLFGLYSYEIYLLHWPILSRYDIFFRYVPGGFAVILYLLFFVVSGYMLKKVSELFLKK